MVAALRFIFSINGRFHENLIHQAVILGRLSGQEEVAVGVLGDLLPIFACMGCQDTVEQVSVAQNFNGLNFNVRDLAGDAARRLVHHHSAVGQAITFTFRSPSQQNGRTAGRLADAVGRNRAREDLHSVIDGQRGDDFAAGAVDVKMDVFAAIFALQVEQFHHHVIGIACMDIALQEDDTVLQ